MFSRLREHLGTAGLIVAIMALIAALAGGAIAAGGGSGDGKATASAKGKPGPRGKTGKTGPAGPAGPAGPVGPAGPAGGSGAKGETGAVGATGATGAAGAAGANGATVLSGAAIPTTQGSVGDFYIRTTTSDIYGPKTAGGWGTATALKGAAGAPGQPWTAGGTLPPKATQTGAYVLSTETGAGPYAGVAALTAISFPIPLAAELDETHVKYNVNASSIAPECDNSEHPGTPSFENPEATPGYLCVFSSPGSGGGFNTAEMYIFKQGVTGGFGAGVAGAVLAQEITAAEPGYASGSWAVTAPVPAP